MVGAAVPESWVAAIVSASGFVALDRDAAAASSEGGVAARGVLGARVDDFGRGAGRTIRRCPTAWCDCGTRCGTTRSQAPPKRRARRLVRWCRLLHPPPHPRLCSGPGWRGSTSVRRRSATPSRRAPPGQSSTNPRRCPNSPASMLRVTSPRTCRTARRGRPRGPRSSRRPCRRRWRCPWRRRRCHRRRDEMPTASHSSCPELPT